MTIIFLLACLSIFESFFATAVPDTTVLKHTLRAEPYDGLPVWSFKKNFFDNASRKSGIRGNKSFMIFSNMDFGAFGVSKITLGMKTRADLKRVKETLSIHLDDTENPVLYLQLKDIDVASEKSSKGNLLTYDLTIPGGVYEVYIGALDEKDKDPYKYFKSVQFYPANPPTVSPAYYLISSSSGRALTGMVSDYHMGSYKVLHSTHSLHGWPGQKFKIVKVCGGGYKIVTSFEDRVLGAENQSSANQAKIVADDFEDFPHQIWDIEEFDGGFRFFPRHIRSKCLNLYAARNEDGAVVTISECNKTKAQTWILVKAG